MGHGQDQEDKVSLPAALMQGVAIGYVAPNVETWTKPVNAAPPGSPSFPRRRDPYEQAYFTSNSYYDWILDRVFFFGAAQNYVAKMLESFKEFPPRQKAGSFGIDQVMEKLQPNGG